MSEPAPIRLAVVGLGLIGGSLARALREAGEVATISGYDRDPAQVQAALALGVIDRAGVDAADAVRDADVAVIAVPVLATTSALAACKPGLSARTIVTDVGSTKQSVLAAVRSVFGEVPARFVAAHPIAGTEKSGVANALPGLFRNHRLILTPHATQDAEALATVERLWAATGARVVKMDAARHDAIFAATSHLPHLLAYSFVDMLDQLEGADADIFPNAGGGFRDFTRIASSSPRMWHDILRANAEPVAALLKKQIDELSRLHGMIERGDWEAMHAVFERARAARERHLTRIE
ncbi:MAG: prephenate dehydrogenase/arogenate dehydrogenase family protein [Gammaproteobacteria bacterium]|nr:prephenate dehydrogenase/arogenate dehydrogenase family protein [Gammaproteobacteria bacterium]